MLKKLYEGPAETCVGLPSALDGIGRPLAVYLWWRKYRTATCRWAGGPSGVTKWHIGGWWGTAEDSACTVS